MDRFLMARQKNVFTMVDIIERMLTKKKRNKAMKNKTELRSTLRLFLDTIKEILINEENAYIEIRRFGSFYMKERRRTEGKNPKTGEKIKIKPYKRAVFKPSRTLKKYKKISKIDIVEKSTPMMNNIL
jgi:integration host factor subunit beta